MSFINIFAVLFTSAHFYNVDLLHAVHVMNTNCDPDFDCKLGPTIITVTRSETFTLKTPWTINQLVINIDPSKPNDNHNVLNELDTLVFNINVKSSETDLSCIFKLSTTCARDVVNVCHFSARRCLERFTYVSMWKKNPADYIHIR